jgi:hypothetical protein
VKFRVLGLEGFKFAEQFVVIRIRDFRSGLIVIQLVMAGEEGAEFADSFTRASLEREGK